MRQRFIVAVIIILLTPWILPQKVSASPEQSYKDYLYQSDQYRQAYNDFKVAKNEYDKFNTLTSQTSALDKSKTMLSSRDMLLRSYLLLLSEKLTNSDGVSQSDKTLYKSVIDNEIVFLNKHSELVASIGSVGDATQVSEQLESHYKVLSASIRQITTSLAIGNVALLARQYDDTVSTIRTFISSIRLDLPQDKQSIVDRWMISVVDKRNLYQQKIDTVIQTNAALKAADISKLDSTVSIMQRNIAEARSYLLEGSANMTELIGVLKKGN